VAAQNWETARTQSHMHQGKEDQVKGRGSRSVPGLSSSAACPMVEPPYARTSSPLIKTPSKENLRPVAMVFADCYGPVIDGTYALFTVL